MTDALIVLTTTATKEEADTIADALLGARLAACAQVIGPIHSRAWWDGAFQETGEFLMVLKTLRANYGALEAKLRELHSYDVPQILAVPVEAGSEAYLAWLAREADPSRTEA